eukprot:9133284-Ditylum_brightwellii.AAC.1
MAHISHKLQQVDARQLLYNGYFRYIEKKNNKEEQRCKVNNRVFYNGSINDREAVRKSLQLELKR